jgi:hypothetical protein
MPSVTWCLGQRAVGIGFLAGFYFRLKDAIAIPQEELHYYDTYVRFCNTIMQQASWTRGPHSNPTRLVKDGNLPLRELLRAFSSRFQRNRNSPVPKRFRRLIVRLFYSTGPEICSSLFRPRQVAPHGGEVPLPIPMGDRANRAPTLLRGAEHRPLRSSGLAKLNVVQAAIEL